MGRAPGCSSSLNWQVAWPLPGGGIGVRRGRGHLRSQQVVLMLHSLEASAAAKADAGMCLGAASGCLRVHLTGKHQG